MTLPPISEILPHRGTMLLLDEVLAFDVREISAAYAPRRDAWYADARGNMPAWIGIELMAQAIAAHVGLLKRNEGKPAAPGVLLGARRYAATRPAFAPDEVLRVSATVTLRDESGLAAYDCGIEVGGAVLARATLKVFEPVDFEAFLRTARP